MKTLVLAAFALAFGATDVFAASELYFVQDMECRGTVEGGAHSGADYSQILMVFTSFKSTRRDGTLANSLEIKNDYAKLGEKMDPETANWGEIWQGAPLRKAGQKVFRKSLSGRDDDLELTVKYVQHRRGAQVEILEGFWSTEGDVGGRKGYNLRCTAHVVGEDEIKRIDDNTARR